MGTMVVTGTAGGQPTSQRRKPKRAVRGSRRHAIQKLKHYLTVVANQDAKEAARAEQQDYVPYLFTVRPGNVIQTSLVRLLKQCNDVLAATMY